MFQNLIEASPNVPVQYTKLQEQYTEAFNTITEQKHLIAQLEEDLRNVNALSSMFRGEGEVCWTAISLQRVITHCLPQGEAGPASQVAEFVADAVKDVVIPRRDLNYLSNFIYE